MCLHLDTLNCRWLSSTQELMVFIHVVVQNSRIDICKFVVSYSIVFKQVEVSTILVSVESTGSWLHAGTCPVFVR